MPQMVVGGKGGGRGGGGSCGICQQGGLPSRGKTEAYKHINALELKAVFPGLQSFIKEEKIHIKVFSDSTTAIRCINKK